jgi:hypothetical protein
LTGSQLEAIKQTKVDLDVVPAIYNVPTDGGAAYVRQRDLIVDAIKTYGTGNILGLTVGNEWMLESVDHFFLLQLVVIKRY